MSTLKAANISNLAGTAVASTDRVVNGSAFSWVNFNGTGTVAIRASYNVTSITDNGVGDWTVNFTTAAIDANYGVSLSIATVLSSTAASRNASLQPHVPTTSGVRVVSTDLQNGLVADVDFVSLSIFC